MPSFQSCDKKIHVLSQSSMKLREIDHRISERKRDCLAVNVGVLVGEFCNADIYMLQAPHLWVIKINLKSIVKSVSCPIID